MFNDDAFRVDGGDPLTDLHGDVDDDDDDDEEECRVCRGPAEEG
jgi:hypothetical protein